MDFLVQGEGGELRLVECNAAVTPEMAKPVVRGSARSADGSSPGGNENDVLGFVARHGGSGGKGVCGGALFELGFGGGGQGKDEQAA